MTDSFLPPLLGHLRAVINEILSSAHYLLGKACAVRTHFPDIFNWQIMDVIYCECSTKTVIHQHKTLKKKEKKKSTGISEESFK